MKPSQRSIIEPFRAMQVIAEAGKLERSGKNIVLMCVGQPGAPAPTPARKAATEAIAVGRIGYTNAAGIEPLRARIKQYYQDRYNVEVKQDCIFVTTGSSAGFNLTFLSAFDVGDRVVIPSPGYPAYRNILKSLSLEAVEIEANSASNWVISPEMLLEEHKKKPVDGILIANPNNPNGTMMEPEDFIRLVEVCRDNSIKLISDEIYHGLTYDKREVTALEIDDDLFVINSFSKYFCMTGWRIGWMIVPESMVETVTRLQQNSFICAPEISQIAALAAFDGIDEMEQVKQGYLSNRNIVMSQLKEIGVTEIQPIDGAFYAYFNVGGLLNKTGCNDSMQLANRILHEAGVALTPGIDFDSKRGGDWMRLSFACEESQLNEGFKRLKNWLEKST